jgi:Niemann-Pick C1 protein
VEAFLGTAFGSDYKDHIKWNARYPSFGLPFHSTRLPFFHPAAMQYSAADQEACVNDLRAIMADDPVGQYGFPFGMDYVFWEVWSALVVELRNNLFMAFFCIAVCCSLLLLHPGAALLIVVLVIISEIMLFGYMSICGIALNSVSLAICVMSIGLIVDYCAHIIHHFMIVSGTRPE